jgi:GNAT superfamily N-acetyltransferase
VRIRPTTEADLPALHDVFRQAIGELYRRRRLTPPDPPRESFVAQQQHVLVHDRERCWPAVVGGRPVAYVAAWVRGTTWFLASLFVLPEAQGRGVGGELLDRAWHGAAERRLTLTDAIQPVSNALYARRGLVPATPLLSLAGESRIAAPAGLEPADPEPEALATLDRAAYGFDRAADHVHWERFAEPRLWLREGGPVAYAYTWPHGRVGPVAGIDEEAAGAAVRAELARRSGQSAHVFAPGSSWGIVRAAFEAGLRLGESPGLLLVSPPHRPPGALAISSYTLF